MATIEMTAKTILVISPLPTHPQDEGANRRVFAMMQVLHDAGHLIHFVYVRKNRGDEMAMRRFWGERLHVLDYADPTSPQLKFLLKLKSRLKTPHRYGIDDWFDPALVQPLLELRERINPDVVIAEYVYMSQALPLFDSACLKIIDTHDVMTDRHARSIAQGQRPRWFSTIAEEEARGLDRADFVLAIQDRERDFLQSITRRPVVTVEHIAVVSPLWENTQADTLLYVGTNNTSNVQGLNFFIAQVLPLIVRHKPALKLHVVGKVCAAIADTPSVVKRGLVDDLAALYATVGVVINPVLFGTGLKIKNVEALGFGCPLVTTSVGAEGMEAGIGNAFVVADDADSMSAAIVALLDDRVAAGALGSAGMALVGQMNRRSTDALLRAMAGELPQRDPAAAAVLACGGVA